MAKEFSFPEVTKRELQNAEPFRLNQLLKQLAEQVSKVQGALGPFTFGPDPIGIPNLTVNQAFFIGNSRVYTGTGSPNGQIAGNVGDLYLRTDVDSSGNAAGGAGTVFWVKESAGGKTTGWVAK